MQHAKVDASKPPCFFFFFSAQTFVDSRRCNIYLGLVTLFCWMLQGFRYVASGPMVRSSYKAGEFYIKSMIESDRAGSSSQLSV